MPPTWLTVLDWAALAAGVASAAALVLLHPEHGRTT
jgi:hypothetical protein